MELQMWDPPSRPDRPWECAPSATGDRRTKPVILAFDLNAARLPFLGCVCLHALTQSPFPTHPSATNSSNTPPFLDTCMLKVVLEVACFAGGAPHRFEGLPASFGKRLPRRRSDTAAGGGELPAVYSLVVVRAPAGIAAITSDTQTRGTAGSSGRDDAALLAAAAAAAAPEDGCAPLSHSYGEGTALLLPRGRCDFLTKAAHVRAANASAMVVYDSQPGSCDAMGYDPAAAATPGQLQQLGSLAALSVSHSTGAALIALAGGGAGGAPSLAVWVQPPPVFDAASLALWAAAVGTVAAGAALAGLDYQRSLRLPTAAASLAVAGLGDAASLSKRQSRGSERHGEAFMLTASSALAFVGLSTALLLLMYLFLSDATYWVLVALYCVAAVQVRVRRWVGDVGLQRASRGGAIESSLLVRRK